MKKLLAILLLLATSIAFAQDEINSKSENVGSDKYIDKDLHSMRQIKGSNEIVKQFFESSSVDFKQDTIYVILVPPLVCSRCEGTINPFIYSLKKKDEKAEVVLIAFYPRKDALAKYLNDREFRADHIIASTDDSFLENFSFSSEKMQAPFITKMTTGGDMLCGKSTLGINMDEDFINWILTIRRSMPKIQPKKTSDYEKSDTHNIEITSMNRIVLKPFKEITIGETADFPISKCLYPGISSDLKYFAFMDELSFNIYVYKIADETAYLYTSIKPGSEVERLYIDESINDSLYYVLKKMNIVNAMFFGSTFQGDNLIISASLPNIFFRDKNKEELAYYNQVSYLNYNIPNREFLEIMDPDLSLESELIADHTNTIILNNGNYFFIPVSKGWPVSGHEKLSEVPDDDNPFLQEFYDNCPVFSIYDKNGEFISYLGKLDSMFEKYRLGYTFSNPSAAYYSGTYWISDAYSGIIETYSDIKDPLPVKRIKIFNAPDKEIKVDKANPLEYMKSFNKIFQSLIIDFRVLDDKIYCIIKQGDYFTLKTLDTDGKILNQAFLPNTYGTITIESYLIQIINKKVCVAGIFSSKDDYKLVLFSTDF